MTPAWYPLRRLSVGAVTVGVAALGPIPATAAPACPRPERYAADANAELLRLNRLDLNPAGHSGTPVTGVGLASARSAMVAESAMNSAAAARMLDGQPSGRTASAPLTRPAYQQAPPTNPAAYRVAVPAQQTGPLRTGPGRLSSLARWDAAMACGAGAGEVTTARASLRDAALLPGDGGPLVAVSRGLQSRSTTALQRRGADVHTVATAAVTVPEIRLLADAVRVSVTRAPRLTTSVSAHEGSAEVQYSPPVLEVSGDGFAAQRLQAPGDQVELALPRRGARIESAPAADPLRALLAGQPAGALRGLTRSTARTLPDLPGLPPRPGIPAVPGAVAESGEPDVAAGATGDSVRISIGDVRQAAAGHAVAARAVTVHVQVVAGRSAAGPGGVVLDLDLGVLEAAAVAPGPGTDGDAGTAGGAGGGLPVTGSRIDLTLLAGGGLLAGGAMFLHFGLRGRRRV